MKLILLLAFAGHILCGISDCLLSYSRSGRLNLKDISDNEKMNKMFADMPLSFPLCSVLMGTFAITMFAFGYLELSKWMGGFSKVASTVMYISALCFLIPIVTHHVFCGVIEWMYIRLGRTAEVRDAVLEFQKKTIVTMFAGYLGLLVYLCTLFIMVVTGKTTLPCQACVFNTLIFMIAMLPTKLPAKGNIAGALMMLGLLILI